MINYKYGLDVILYILGAFQMVPAIYFYLYMRDTQGLTTKQKKKLYLVSTEGDEQLDVENVLPAIDSNRYSYTLVLDLDETLVHYDWNNKQFKIRPYARTFLKEMSHPRCTAARGAVARTWDEASAGEPNRKTVEGTFRGDFSTPAASPPEPNRIKPYGMYRSLPHPVHTPY